MTLSSKALSEQIALFRHALISRLLSVDMSAHQRAEEIKRIVNQSHQIPGSDRTRIAESTLRGWLRDYQRGGFDALIPRTRADAGHSRTLSPEVIERLTQLKEKDPARPIRKLIDQVREERLIKPDQHLPRSTVHRLLQHVESAESQQGKQDRRRFTFKQAGQLWMSDVMHGPAVVDTGKRKRKTYLIAFLDDATRVIPHAEFTFKENTQTFLPVFKQALLRRGIPQRLYVDNGANYRCHHLSLVCAKLGIALIHAKPRQPQGKGKIERFFRTVRAQLLTELTGDHLQSLTALNRRLAGWIEGEYHHNPHRGIGLNTPLDQWALSADNVCYPDARLDIDDLFLFETTRKVTKDRTVSIDGKLFEVDPILIGERVTLRFHPADLKRGVQVVHKGKWIEHARLLDLYANCHVKRDRRSGVIESDTPVSTVNNTSMKLTVLNNEPVQPAETATAVNSAQTMNSK